MAKDRKASGEKIRQARLRAGMTQAELARAAGVSERNIVRWENDQHEPRLGHLIDVAAECGVKVDDLLEGDDEKPEDAPTAREAAIYEALRPLARALATS